MRSFTTLRVLVTTRGVVREFLGFCLQAPDPLGKLAFLWGLKIIGILVRVMMKLGAPRNIRPLDNSECGTVDGRNPAPI